MVATGAMLQSIGMGGAEGAQAFFALLLPQAMALWALAISTSQFWRDVESLQLGELQRTFRLHPLLTLAALVSLFAIAGLPLLGSFSAHLAIWRALGDRSVFALAASLIGSLGLAAAAVRVLYSWVGPAQKSQPLPMHKDDLGRAVQPESDMASPYVMVFFGSWLLLMLGFGLLPHIFLAAVPSLAAMFPQLFP
jgi:formate hydrogenlyase subunit 3/multisubunit Na+/H+ antiporter MnhD subunit